MATPYERGYRKIAMLAELSPGEPKIYRTGGATILLLRTAFGVRAVDATGSMFTSGGAPDHSALLERPPLPSETHDEAVWVCVDPAA